MEPAKVVLSSDVLGRTEAGAVYGNISLQSGDIWFPDACWTDFVVVILTWWCQAVLRILRGDGGPVEIPFMEGPFLVSVSVGEPEMWHLSLIENGLERRLENQMSVRRDVLIASVVEASDKTIAYCRRQGWSSSDVEELAITAAAVRQEMKRLAI